MWVNQEARSARILNYPITKLPIYQILLDSFARLLFTHEDRVLCRLRFAFDGESGYRMVWRCGRQAGEAYAIGILFELYFFAAGQQPGRLYRCLQTAERYDFTRPVMHMHIESVSLASKAGVVVPAH